MRKYLNVIGIFVLLSIFTYGKQEFLNIKCRDGIYESSLGEEKPISSFLVRLELKDNRIITSEVVFQDLDEIANENHSEDRKKKTKQIVQDSLYIMNQYAKMLLEVQNPEEIDVISGATVSHDLFKQAVWKALESAKKE